MRPRLLLPLLLLVLSFAAPAAHAQCQDWIAGPLEGPNGADAPVLAFTSWDPDGGGPLQSMLVAGGGFEHIEGVEAGHIAARDPLTGEWQALGNPIFPANSVDALAVFNGELIAAGSFVALGGSAVNRIARWDGSAWQPLGSGIDNGAVRALTIYNGELIVAGSFSLVGGAAMNNIARWNGVSWQTVGTGANAVILALAVFNGELIAGGSFTTAGGGGALRIARWNGSIWQTLSFGMNTSVYSLTLFNGQLVAGGAFTTAGGSATNYIARWNGTNWFTLGVGMDNAVRAVTAHDGLLIAGGLFQNAGGGPARCVASWNGAAWSQMSSGIQDFNSTPDVRAVFSYTSGHLVAGGDFEIASSTTANYIARWNGTRWDSYGGGNAAAVDAFINYRGRLVAAGSFNQMTIGASANDIVEWDGTRLYNLGLGMDEEIFALESFKYAGPLGDNELIAGGDFNAAGGVAAPRIARWVEDPVVVFPPPAWAPMGAGFSSGIVYAIERFAGSTYAAGSFLMTGATGISRIARWNETTDVWEPLSTGMNSTVYALKTYGGFLYAGGAFTTAGGVGTGGLARWDGATWSQVGGNFAGTVYALELHGSDLVIGGLYPGINASPNLAYWNGASYGTFGVGGGTNGAVRSIASLNGRVYIGGDFTTAGGVAANRAAYWDGSWHEAASGADNSVRALFPYRDEIHAGGLFENVRGSALLSPTWGRYLPVGAPWAAFQPNSQIVNPGDDASFTVTPADGYDPVTYQWYRFTVPLSNGPTGNGSTISGATTPTLTVADAATEDAGEYWVALSNSCGSDSSLAAGLTVGTVTGVPDAGSAGRTVLEALGPNPSDGASRLTFSLTSAAEVRVRVHDVGGRLVRRIDVGRLPAGRHHASWDGRRTDGTPVRTGLFFLALEVEGRSIGTRRLAIVR